MQKQCMHVHVYASCDIAPPPCQHSSRQSLPLIYTQHLFYQIQYKITLLTKTHLFRSISHIIFLFLFEILCCEVENHPPPCVLNMFASIEFFILNLLVLYYEWAIPLYVECGTIQTSNLMHNLLPFKPRILNLLWIGIVFRYFLHFIGIYCHGLPIEK